MTTSQQQLDPEQIQRFALALVQAVHDTKHETAGDIDIVHYWDSDSLVVPIRGFKAFETQNDNTSPENSFIQSLLAAGLLGQVRLTAAHRSELLALVDGWSSEPQDTDERFREEARLFIKRQEILTQPWLDMSRSVGDAQSQELKELTRLTGSYFAILESVAADWRTRWNRLVDVKGIIDIRSSDHNMADLAQDPRFEQFAQLIASARKRPRPLATAIDAVALVEIARLTDAARKGAIVSPRFFTSSPSLRKAYQRSDKLQAALSYSYSSSLTNRTDTVWRDTNYYFLRASIPSLMRPGLATKNEGPSLRELEILANSLTHIGRLELSSIRSLQKDAEPLIEAIRRFEEMGTAHIWLSYDFHEVATHLTDGLSQILGSSDRAAVSKGLVRLRQEVQDEAQDFGLALEIAGVIQAVGAAAASSRQDPCLSMKSDLGSVRWDVIPVEEQDSICFGPLVLGGALAMQLFTIDAIKSNVAEAERACALLLGFDQYGLAAKLVDRLGPKTDSDRLRLMSQIARIKSSDTLFVSSEFEFLRISFQALSDERKDALAIGYCFAAFSLWERAIRRSTLNSPAHREVLDWAFNVVLNRIQSFGLELTRAFALNQLIYVATCGEISHPALPDLILEFDQVARRSRNHRFLDTLGWRVLKTTRATGKNGGSSRAGLSDALRLLAEAAALAPFDQTVSGHLQVAREYATDTRGL